MDNISWGIINRINIMSMFVKIMKNYWVQSE